MILTLLGAEFEIDETYVCETKEPVRRQVRAYERGDRTTFDLDVTIPDGFLGDVMGRMNEIPYGEMRTYGELAASLDTAPVAVGQACAANPIPLIVPCHRVVASDGSLRGYSGAGGIETKRRLLDHESANSSDSVQAELPVDR
ncbi:methylated-DNA--[protein]-cysteine S-methyltransferase [Halovivax gelatinilyticus]|uniref:methylated-DNA--[protein]-cysteine S-methyltransferase n=1 Tax=Halovivax gelatinilyticus TaxID=2961597 RepID=UPI0020CA4912|nr:methylated-DNA--[protein]-cysteine S-methyltransferase [Halovivax gelatinilyticus]